MDRYVSLHYGDGGKATKKLIEEVFYKHFKNPILAQNKDAAILQKCDGRMAFTTDSFVVKPLFFKGGDIGKLSICGTINDLVAVGAIPLYISVGFIIEEGLSLEVLEKIAQSMGVISRKNKVMIVTGDTKVVEKGSSDGIFINTAGIGIVHEKYNNRPLAAGDEILITGGIAEHGTVILSERYNLEIESELESDCNALSNIIKELGDDIQYIKLMRDPTRGGLATALCEISETEKIGMIIKENNIPVDSKVEAIHSLLGTDPLYFASEGRMIIIVEKGYGKMVKQRLVNILNNENTQIIGHCINEEWYTVRMITKIGGNRIITPLENQIIPRIC